MEIGQTASLVIIVGLLLNLAAVAALGWHISRFVSRLEMKVELMWVEYKTRNKIGDYGD